MKELMNIQSALKVPKDQKNDFGNYSYRSLDDIQEALKPLLLANKCTLVIVDSIELIGDRYYVKATVTLKVIETSKTEIGVGYARESQTKKGMDESQITGACSSYARKYALNGLFAIDDTVDADGKDNTGTKTGIDAIDKSTDKDPSTSEQKNEIIKLAKLKGFNLNEICSSYKCSSLPKMKFEDAKLAIAKLRLKKDVV